MGRFLCIGLNTQLVISRTPYRRPEVSQEEVEKAVEQFWVNKDIYDLSVTEKDWIYTLKKEAIEKEWLSFLKDFYEMRYTGCGVEKYVNKALEMLSERSGFEEWMALANERMNPFYQTDKRLDWVSAGKWVSIYDMQIECVLLSMDGKIIMECYRDVLRFFTYCVRERLKHYRLAQAVEVYISD